MAGERSGTRLKAECLADQLLLLLDTPTPTSTATPTPTYKPPPTYTPLPTNTPIPTIYVPPQIVTIAPPRPLDTQPPPAPSGLLPCGSQRAPTYACGNVTLTWNSVKDQSGISQYSISVTNIYTSNVQKYFSTDSSHTLEGVAEGQYMWVVSAQDNAGNWGPTSDACYFYCSIVK